MAYRRDKIMWCHNCSQLPMASFKERKDKPPTWSGQSCARNTRRLAMLVIPSTRRSKLPQSTRYNS